MEEISKEKTTKMEKRERRKKWSTDRRKRILDLNVDGGLAVVGVLLASEGLIGGGGHEAELAVLELLEGLEDDAGDDVASGSGDHAPATGLNFRKAQSEAEGSRRRRRGLRGCGGEERERMRSLEKHSVRGSAGESRRERIGMREHRKRRVDIVRRETGRRSERWRSMGLETGAHGGLVAITRLWPSRDWRVGSGVDSGWGIFPKISSFFLVRTVTIFSKNWIVLWAVFLISFFLKVRI